MANANARGGYHRAYSNYDPDRWDTNNPDSYNDPYYEYGDGPSQFPSRPPDGPDAPTSPNAPPTTPPPTAADPWDTAPADGNWQNWFLQNIQGVTPNSAGLISVEPKLLKHGIKVLRNASNIAGKIQLPNGQIVDVGRGFSGNNPGYMAWVWQDGAGGGGEVPAAPVNPEYLAPFTEAQPVRPEVPGFVAPEFKTPTAQDVLGDPGYQFVLDQGRGAIESAAAHRGTLNSGGTLKDILGFGQRAASQYWNNAWDRLFSQWQGESTNALNAWRANADSVNSAYDDNYAGWLGRRDTWYSNQRNPFEILNAAGQYGG